MNARHDSRVASSDASRLPLSLRAARYLWRATVWAYGHPFILRRLVWVCIGFALVVALAVLLVFPVRPFVARLIPAFLLAIVGAALVGWRRIGRRPEGRLLAFVAQFAGATSEDLSAGVQHQRALVARLKAQSLLATLVDVRPVAAPLTRDSAINLSRGTAAAAVVYGEVLAIAGSAKWTGEIVLRPAGTSQVAHIEGSGAVTFHDRARRAPALHEALPPDPDYPLSRLTAERLEADHADCAEGTLLVLLGEHASAAGDRDVAREAIDLAGSFRPALSALSRARLEVVRAELARAAGRPVQTVLLELEQSGLAHANHSVLWTFGAAVALLAAEDLSDLRFRFAERAVAADAEDSTAHYNFAEALAAAGDPDRALHEYELAARDPFYADRHYLHLSRGVLLYNKGHYAAARNAYRRAAELEETAQARVYLADAHRQLGEQKEAKQNYRRALQLDPTVVDAHRGYWGVGHPGFRDHLSARAFDGLMRRLVEARPVAPPLNRWLRPLLWRILWLHYRRHPEDSRIHYMLGFCALLQGYLATAEERLRFSYQLAPDWHDLEALGVLAVAIGLQGRLEEARQLLVKLRDAPPRPGLRADAPIDRYVGILLAPLYWEPRLVRHPDGARFGAIAQEVFARALPNPPNLWRG